MPIDAFVEVVSQPERWIAASAGGAFGAAIAFGTFVIVVLFAAGVFGGAGYAPGSEFLT